MGGSSSRITKRGVLTCVGAGLLGALPGYSGRLAVVAEAQPTKVLEDERFSTAGGKSALPRGPYSPRVSIDLTCSKLVVTVEPRFAVYYLRTRHRDEETNQFVNSVHGPYEGTVTDPFGGLDAVIVDVEVHWRGNVLQWAVRPAYCKDAGTAGRTGVGLGADSTAPPAADSPD